MPTQWSEADQAPLGYIAPYATAPLAPLVGADDSVRPPSYERTLVARP